MRTFELITPCHFGLEKIMKYEIMDLGYEVASVDNGKVTFIGDARAIADANLCFRTTERVLIKVDEFRAVTFEELFEKTKAIRWEDFIPKDGKFWVAKANSVKSKLFSPSDIQSIIKKAIVERLKSVHKISWFEESGASYPLRVSILNDQVTIGLDTTGVSLHKRGYRKMTAKAPITETLAAALLKLTPWKKDRILVDPFCGSGTFSIEAALMAANIAPGLHRGFLAESWSNLVPQGYWKDAREEASDMIEMPEKLEIQGYDIDASVVAAARANAKAAGVEGLIHFQQRPVDRLSHHGKYGFIVTNPPYGERLEEKEALPALYRSLGERFADLDTWSMYLISGYSETEKQIGKKATKNRKIYNGMLKTYFYQFEGPKPPRPQAKKG